MKPRQYLKTNAIQAYVLGLLSIEENEEMEIMLSLHPQLHHSVMEYRRLLNNNGSDGPVPPAQVTWEQIEEQLRLLPGNNLKAQPMAEGAATQRLASFISVSANNAFIFIQRKWVVNLLVYTCISLLLLCGVLLLRHHYQEQLQQARNLHEQLK